MDDPREVVLRNLDLLECRVEFSKSPTVLLCGGKIGEKHQPDDDDLPLKSFRDAITKKSTPYEIFRPEEIKTWQNDGIYKNLMDFDADLASICSLVVIVIESPGSIAELGAFSQLDDLSKKLIVIKSQNFSNAPSFINLGILAYPYYF